jgi:hypothetical protein
MKREVYVIYLQFESNLDENFITLSQIFTSFGMTLIPVKLDEFKHLRHCEGENILAIVRDMDSLRKYRSLLKRYLNYPLRMGTMTMYETSSFTIEHESRLLRNKAIIQERLPLSMFHIVTTIGESIYNRMITEDKKWPGGRRVKVPV